MQTLALDLNLKYLFVLYILEELSGEVLWPPKRIEYNCQECRSSVIPIPHALDIA